MLTRFADNSITCYDYNCIGELTQVTDADGYQTTYTYNGFGQQTERNHPDAGITRRRFDAAGNIICTKNQKQIDINDSTTYHYRFDRLTEIHHAVHPWENVSLNYDMAGRLALREDRTGYERLWYDEFGNVRQTSKRIITPADQVAFCFMTRYNYDSFGRIREITYPDGENVNYSYYVDGGNLYQVQGAQVKVTNIRHDEIEHIVHKQYLNGCYSDYQYDSDRQWLKNIWSASMPDGNTVFQELSYVYDAASNPTFIYQNASQWHSMGGKYNDEYFYDNRYRLAQNLHDDGYTGTTLYDMTYSRTSRIGSKQSIHPSLGYPDLVYGYDNSVHTHQPRVIHDNNSNEHMQLYWDANGNLRQLQSKSGNTRFHLWDDDNMLLLSVGPQSCGYYGNASDGKRAYKLAGTYDVSYINGQYVEGTALFDNAVLYPNPYMTVSNKCYTKHYFMGSERFCTTIGGGNNGNWLINPIDDLTTDEERLLADLKDNYTYQYYYNDCFDYPHHFHHTANTDYTGTIVPADGHYPDYQYNGYEMYYGTTNLLFYASLYDAIHDFYHHDKDDEPFYYHSDHLGSAAWITDDRGLPVQYIMYAPYGEQLLNQQAVSYDERFKFTGKERDAETGYDYFGARYFEPNFLNDFISVDPLADKFIEESPYLYCKGNPIKYVDENGTFPSFAPISLCWLAAAQVTEKNGYNHNLKTAAYAYQQPYVALRVGIAKYNLTHLPWISTYASNFEINLLKKSAEVSSGNPGDYGNAFRHTLWQAIITSLFGEIEARRIGYAHEDGKTHDLELRIFENKDLADCNVDLLNNEIGRQIGLDNIGAGNNIMAEMVLNYYYNEGLWVTEELSNGQYAIKKVLLTQEQYNAALDKLKRLKNNGLEK